MDVDQETKRYEEAINHENGDLLFKLAKDYRYGKGVNRDYKKAIELHEMAIVRNNIDSMNALGNMYMNGLGTPKDYKKARELFEQGGDTYGCYNNLGIIYLNGFGVKKNNMKAMELFEKAIDKEDTNALLNLGNMYATGAHHIYFKEDFNHNIGDSESGSAESCLCSVEEYEANRNIPKALELYELAHNKDNIEGTRKLAELHMELKNHSKAQELFEKLIDKDSIRGLNSFGKFLKMQNNYLGAREMFEKAFDLEQKQDVKAGTALDNLVSLYRETDLKDNKDYVFNYFLLRGRITNLQDIYNHRDVINSAEELIVNLKNKNKKLEEENSDLKIENDNLKTHILLQPDGESYLKILNDWKIKMNKS